MDSVEDKAALFPQSTLALELLLDEQFDRLYGRLKAEEDRERALRWGGFFRRTSALFVDMLVLAMFSALLFYFAYVAYSMGLAAHGRSLSGESLEIFLRILVFAWLLLVAGYFVLFHGMDGRTVGKWLFGLRVVGADQQPLTFRQALVRCMGALPCAVFGLGFLWVVFHREKRGWHDLLAGTWVIREGRQASWDS